MAILKRGTGGGLLRHPDVAGSLMSGLTGECCCFDCCFAVGTETIATTFGCHVSNITYQPFASTVFHDGDNITVEVEITNSSGSTWDFSVDGAVFIEWSNAIFTLVSSNPVPDFTFTGGARRYDNVLPDLAAGATTTITIVRSINACFIGKSFVLARVGLFAANSMLGLDRVDC